MYKDIYGKNRVKINLHMHTTISDGHVSPEDAIKLYKENGYDAIAITDHWKEGKTLQADGITIYSGCEFHVGSDTAEGVYHIVGFGMTKETGLVKHQGITPQEIIDAIHAANGIAILAHPSWSLNTLEQIMPLKDVDATEIYNTFSECGKSYRADSSNIIDLLSLQKRYYPLVAADDVHLYDGNDDCKAFIMAEAESTDVEEIKKAIREHRFYASQGPEIHVKREGDIITCDCSPVKKIVFVSGCISHIDAVTNGEGLTHAEFHLKGKEHFVRAFVVDANGKKAWSNFAYTDQI